MRLFNIFLFLLPLYAYAQQPGKADAEAPTNYSQQLLQLQSALQKHQPSEQEAVEAAIGLAELYATPAFSAYNPDTAYHYVQMGQRLFRRLGKREQRRLERSGFTLSQARSLKSDIQEKGLEFKLQKQNSQALLDYMAYYSRLPHHLEKRAVSEYLRYRFAELQEESNYDSLKTFSKQHREELREYLPDLGASLQESIYQSYFRAHDSTDIESLIYLLRDFPSTARRLDAPLSRALQQQPFITLAENQLRGVDFRQLPKTVRVIYLYHFYTGEWSDLLGFQNRYPFYADSFNLQRAITVARSAPDLDLGFTKARRGLYERYIELAAPSQKAYAALQQLISRKLEAKNWAAARAEVARFASFFEADDKRLKLLLRLLEEEAEDIAPVSLGDTVNSVYGEYAPVISADGQRVFFCRNLDGNEDIYRAEKRQGHWQRPMPIAELNTENSHEAPLAISPDGSTLLMYDGGVVKYTKRSEEGWSTPRPFFQESRRPDWQGMTCLSSDQQTAILAARSINCIGARNNENIDLFIARRQEDGSWGKPINLGTTLNTPFEDRSPFLHPDQRTLYFSSSGHGGLGELDVFVTKRIGEGWTEWTEPVNLGKEINGPGYDWGYRISTDGSMAYFSTHVPGWKEELYRITVPERHRPTPVTTISGQLLGLEELPPDTRVIIQNLGTGEPVGVAEPNPESGEFFVTLPIGNLYSYTVEGSGLFPAGDHIDLRSADRAGEVETELSITTIEQAQADGMALPLKNLFFETDSYRLKPASFPELNRLAELVQTYDLQVEIAGHTDDRGGAAYNMELSQNRAESASRYLIEKGCEPEQISAKGYGLTQPVASNATAEGRAQNRRVEIRFEKSME